MDKSSHGGRRVLGLRAAAAIVTTMAALLCSTSVALTPDGEALLELKLAFNATTQKLTSWRPTDPNPCEWEGISCSFPDLRVQSINLPYMQLGGVISPSIGKLDKLQRIALHQNSLHGPIPAEIKNCTELRAISPELSLAYAKLIQQSAVFKGYSAAFRALKLAEEKFPSSTNSHIQLLKMQLLHERALHRGHLRVAQQICDEFGVLSSCVSGADIELKTEASLFPYT